jgi:hypothetical protein
VDNTAPIPCRDRRFQRNLSEFLTRASRRAASGVWDMSQPIRPADHRPGLSGRRRRRLGRPRRSAKRCWSATRFSLNFPAGSARGYDRDHWSSCDSSHWGRVGREGRRHPNDNATDQAAVGGISVALVRRFVHVQSLLLARRFARRPDRPGFAGGPRSHRLVLRSRRGVFTLRTRSCGARGDGAGLTWLTNPSRRPANSLRVERQN